MKEWIAAGQAPDLFWKQTPRTFIAVMEGSALAAKRQQERNIMFAWDIARMGLDAQSKRGLRKPKFYLDELKPKAPLSGGELTSFFRAMKKRGTPVRITKLAKSG